MGSGGGGGGGWRGGDTSMAQDAYKMCTPGLILGFRGFKSSSNFGDSWFSLDFETSYVALFNGLTISVIRIVVHHVYCFGSTGINLNRKTNLPYLTNHMRCQLTTQQ